MNSKKLLRNTRNKLIQQLAICSMVCVVLTSSQQQGIGATINVLADKAQPMKQLADFHPQLFWNRPPEGKLNAFYNMCDYEYENRFL